ncbi:type VII secretion protein EccB [Kitasatospora sp. MAP12-15]|uniref:type VII secretion protein EccB n=1 Tax=unclassified Kitasatospora TaxID=2633591 RepID=UPI0024752395|nr:type VII secretion protein EccB [Kitasatospora sp. MAP12-44]MDH6113186.1 type VII secretion protein EccB [Kitasatospora sp. MAP12-44]
MASRRDELNAYTFARKRTVGAFLQPGGGGNDEDAPRPVRAVVPSLVLAAVIVAGFGVWGMIKPSAPQGWDSGSNVILGKDSTTRYVILPGSDGSKVLHPVLNMASAKLVLPVDSKVVFVADSVLDNYRSHGPTIGIPYAPDKLPSADDAGRTKKWSVCDRPGADDAHPNQAVFVAAGADADMLARPDRVLSGAQSLYVQAIDQNGVAGTQYLIDPQGRKHVVGTPGMSAVDLTALRTALFGTQAKPERVTDQWLKTLLDGTPIGFPEVPGLTQAKTPSSVQLSDPAERFVGRLVTFGASDYVVGADRLYQVSAFQAELMRQRPLLENTYDGQVPSIHPITPADNARFTQPQDTSGPLGVMPDWPQTRPLPSPANSGDAQIARPVVCSTFDGMNGAAVQRSVWAGTDFPAPFTTGSASAHVSPGHGLFYRAMDNGTGSGSDYLITETGLRYSVPATSEGTAAGAPAAQPTADPSAAAQPQVNEAQARLGYKDTTPAPVPREWSDLVPAGPALNTNTATQAQNS